MKIILKKIVKRIVQIGVVFFILYLATLVFFYFKQERFFFNPKKLDSNYTYSFSEEFEEINIAVQDDIYLNTLLFKTENPKGVVLYLHGNAGALHDWGKRAHLFLNNQYDVLFVDYRGYGKSTGEYSNEQELFSDVQLVYDELNKRYPEEQIILLGYSLGSGLAAHVAANNKPKHLILNAPYYSWKKLVADEIAPPVPKYLINYDIKTYEYLAQVSCPVQIFHGTRDYLINKETNAQMLKDLYPDKIELTYIIDAAHNDIHITKQYFDALPTILE